MTFNSCMHCGVPQHEVMINDNITVGLCCENCAAKIYWICARCKTGGAIGVDNRYLSAETDTEGVCKQCHEELEAELNWPLAWFCLVFKDEPLMNHDSINGMFGHLATTIEESVNSWRYQYSVATGSMGKEEADFFIMADLLKIMWMERKKVAKIVNVFRIS